jgi:tRNA pseudouridine38-40 synthase
VAFCLPPGSKRFTGDWSEFRRRLNGALPPDLAVRSLRASAQGFDPRRQATWRVYRYRVRTGGDRRPGERHRTLEIDGRLDVVAMQAAARGLLGERDFASLGAAQHAGRTVRHLREVTIVRHGTLVEVRVTANAFLRRMVRSIVALLIEVGLGRLTPDAAVALVEAPGRALHGRAVPARGLTLERVIYESKKELVPPERAAEQPDEQA